VRVAGSNHVVSADNSVDKDDRRIRHVVERSTSSDRATPEVDIGKSVFGVGPAHACSSEPFLALTAAAVAEKRACLP